MSHFIRLLGEEDKELSISEVVASVRAGRDDERSYVVDPSSFSAIPGQPFAYWVSEPVRQTFRRFPGFESNGRVVRVGIQTSDDFRFARGWWEVARQTISERWFPFAKGGAYSPYYADLHLVVNWDADGAEIKNF